MTVSSVQPQVSHGADNIPAVDDWHIVSLIAYCRPERFTAFKQRLQQQPFTEHHADDEHAKLIITIEASTTSELSQRMDLLRDDPDLLTLQMVYHQDDSVQP